MAVIAIGGDDLIAFADRHLHAGDNGLLSDIEVAKAADLSHAVKLARLLLEAADQRHVLIGAPFLFGAEFRGAGCAAISVSAKLSSIGAAFLHTGPKKGSPINMVFASANPQGRLAQAKATLRRCRR